MERHRTVLTSVLAVLIVLLSGAAGGSWADPGGVSSSPQASDPIVLRRAAPDPGRRARLAAWWEQFEKARPALSVAAVQLRRARERWRGSSTRAGCRAARRALAEIDGPALLGGSGDYMLTLEVGAALDEFEGAAAACLERRYFEFDYRLQLAEAALTAARRRATVQLARPLE